MPKNTESPLSEVLARARNAAVVSQLCGFDPLELLRTVEFPNDRRERLLRVSKDARLMAMRREHIALDGEDEDDPGPVAAEPSAGPPAPLRSPGAANHFVPPPASAFQVAQEELRQRRERQDQGLRRREAEVQCEQLARSAAAVAIQATVRGWLVRRKYVAVRYSRLSASEAGQTIASGDTGRASSAARGRALRPPVQGLVATIPPVGNLALQERLIARFRRYCGRVPYIDGQAPTFPHFCAVAIQAVVRMFLLRRPYVRVRDLLREERRRVQMGGEKSSLDSQDFRKLLDEAKLAIFTRAQRLDYVQSRRLVAAAVIQRSWRRYYVSGTSTRYRADLNLSLILVKSIKIYRFYRDLIRFRERGDPAKLLRFVNPKEAKLIDPASNVHVRFRLGGTSFPPTIYYKIFVHRSLVDMNAFSPRNYTDQASRQALPKLLFNKCMPMPKIEPPEGGWYKRFENNGWRAVSERPVDLRRDPDDDVEWRSANVRVPFHFQKIRRREEAARARRLRRLEWLRKLYIYGKETVESGGAPATENDDESGGDSDGASDDGYSGIESADAAPPARPPSEEPVPVDTVSCFKQPEVAKQLPRRHRRHGGRACGGNVAAGAAEAAAVEATRESELLQAIAELEERVDHDVLVRWTLALDFEAYADNWAALSTTGRSDDPDTYFLQVAELGAGLVGATGEDGALPDDEKQVGGGELGSGPGEVSEAARPGSRPWSGRSDRSMRDLFASTAGAGL